MLNLQVLVTSTRPGRKGAAVGAWMHEQALAHGAFHAELVALADFQLPVFDEAEHPRLRTYAQEHTKRWSESVARADAYVFVLPEYDYSMPAALLNALQFLYHEWSYKPVAFASYGGESGALRSVQMTKQVLTTFKVVPIVEAVTVRMVAQHIDPATGAFMPGDAHPQKARAMLDELHRWAVALKPMRAQGTHGTGGASGRP